MSRRTDIADAAVQTLAAAGMRGLTHRAVDRAAGLAEGSTSFYFRTRAALLGAVLDRLLAMDSPEIPDHALDFDEVIDHMVAVLTEWTTSGRARQLARYEFNLEATRRPELREPLEQAFERVKALGAESFRGVAGEHTDALADRLAPLLEGIVFRRVVAAHPPPIDRGQIAGIVRSELDQLTAGKSKRRRRS